LKILASHLFAKLEIALSGKYRGGIKIEAKGVVLFNGGTGVKIRDVNNLQILADCHQKEYPAKVVICAGLQPF
jgi:hypothetical protein